MQKTVVNLKLNHLKNLLWNTFLILCIQSCFCHFRYSYIPNLHNPLRVSPKLSLWFDETKFCSLVLRLGGLLSSEESAHKPRGSPSTDQTHNICLGLFQHRLSPLDTRWNINFYMIYFMNRWQNQNILADDRSKWQLFVYGKGAAINWKWGASMLDYLSECLLHRWTSRFFRALIISKIACGVFWSSNNSVYFSAQHIRYCEMNLWRVM